MEEEEFQEADMVWPEHDSDRCTILADVPTRQRKLKRSNSQQKGLSAPIDMPARNDAGSSCKLRLACRDSADDNSWEVKVIPPHLIVACRADEKLACSVCTGRGRTLKGRDLLYMRNFILQMTGFYER